MPLNNDLNEVDKFNLKRQERIRASREEAARLKSKEESEYKAQQDADKLKQIAAAMKKSEKGEDLTHKSPIPDKMANWKKCPPSHW